MSKKIEIVVSPKMAAQHDEIVVLAATTAGVNVENIAGSRILRKSIDARKRGDIKVNMCIEIFDENESVVNEEFVLDWKNVKNKPEVIIVGAGPAGLFAALELIENGLRPIIVERGKNVSDRKRDLAAINRNEAINADSNYCFGEGGAGTYSDGKLYTRSKKRGQNRKALEILVKHGASEEILYNAHPHIGTDKLPVIIQNIRQTIESCGGTVLFNTRVTDFIINGDKIEGVVTQNGDKILAQNVILATGHSAKDVYEKLAELEVEMQPKEFAVGVRVEHQQELINKIQYKGAMDEYLPNASYSLVAQVGGRGVYSFCMCPGGFIVPATTEPNSCVVNGMSPSGRNNIYANSGVVTTVKEDDLETYKKHFGILAGLRFQQDIEKLGHSMAGSVGAVAPAQKLDEFVKGKKATKTLPTSYHPGVVQSDMHAWLPKFVGKALADGFKEFDNKMHGFITPEAQIVGIESRTSAVLRIPRDPQTLQHIRIEGLYPTGEGAGYAGGIISAAVDGMVVANKIAQ